jgi:hypothetical protein
MAGFTLLQLDSARGLRSSLCPLQASSADAGGSVAADIAQDRDAQATSTTAFHHA